MGIKKPFTRSDALMREDEGAPKQDDRLSARHTETANQNISHPSVLVVVNNTVQSEIKPKDEERERAGRAISHETEASKSDDAEDSPYDGSKNDSTDHITEKAKGKRGRPRKKKRSKKPEQTLETAIAKINEAKKLFEDEKATEKAATTEKSKLWSKTKAELKRKLKRCEEKLQSEKKCSTDLRNQLAEKENDIAQKTENFFRSIGKGASQALDDDHVLDKFKELRMLWQNWVSDNAISSLDSISEKDIVWLLECAMPIPLSPLESQRLYHQITREEGAPRMLLGILISYSICEELLEDPFAFLEAREKAGLQYVLDHGMLRNQEMTHAWRQMTVQVLNLDDDKAAVGAAKDTDNVQTLAQVREEDCERIAEDICDHASYLLRPLDEIASRSQFEDLVYIIRTARDLSAMLWAQKTHMFTRKLDQDGSLIFRTDSASIRAHPCMCLDKSDHQFDGRPVQLVIEPAIYASGNEDGKNYDQWKVRLPAVGWLSKENTEHAEEVSSEPERPAKRPKFDHVPETVSQAYPGQANQELKDESPLPDGTEGISKLDPLKEHSDSTAADHSTSQLAGDSSGSLSDHTHGTANRPVNLD